jgi:outer membrane lipoprotein LolB
MFNVKHLIMVCCVALLATGCASTRSSSDMLPAKDREQTFDRNQDKISHLKSWQFDGRFSIRSAQGVDSANITWLQESARYLLKISGPLQQGTVFIRGDATGISYKDSKGVTDKAGSPEELLSRHTQYNLPISSLRYWVLGRPDPTYAYNLNIGVNGDLKTLSQNGWDIRYEAFKTTEPYRLPTKIILKHDTIEITISIHDWNPDLVSG